MIAVPVPPLPSPMPAIVREACPWQALPNFGCFYSHGLDGVSQAVIYVGPENDGLWTKWHELGHAYIARYFTPAAGRSLMRAAHMGTWDEEAAADLYAGCHGRVERMVWDQIVYGLDAPFPEPTRRWRARVCAVFVAAALRL